MTTIREHLEAIRNEPWARPEQIADHAVAALVMIDLGNVIGRGGIDGPDVVYPLELIGRVGKDDPADYESLDDEPDPGVSV